MKILLLSMIPLLQITGCGSVERPKIGSSREKPRNEILSDAEITKRIDLMWDEVNVTFQQEFETTDKVNETFLASYVKTFPILSTLTNSDIRRRSAVDKDLEGMALDVIDGVQRGSKAREEGATRFIQEAFVHFGYINGSLRIFFHSDPDTETLSLIQSIYEKYVARIYSLKTEKEERKLHSDFANEAVDLSIE